jgi:hypothetical protein
MQGSEYSRDFHDLNNPKHIPGRDIPIFKFYRLINELNRVFFSWLELTTSSR